MTLRRTANPLALIALAGLGAHATERAGGEPELFLPGIVSTGDDDAHVTFAPEGGRVYFLKDAPNFAHWTIVYSDEKNGSWSEPVVAPFSGRWGDGDLSFSPAGDTAFFVSTRPLRPGDPPRRDTEI